MREVAYAFASRDIASPAYLLLGLPMLGWSPAADGLMARTRETVCPASDFLLGRAHRNNKLLASTKASGDDKLDEETYAKTMVETERGVLLGPYSSLSEVPLGNVALVPCHGIWERQGGAVEKSCRCIDDLLVGEQNDTVGTVSSHRPTDPDGLVAQVRAVRRRFPRANLRGWPCDLEKAYEQVPGDPNQI